jgi:long-chain acyl-CoA synthetase
MGHDVVSVFRRAAAHHAERPFLFDRHESVTYGEADARSELIAAELVARGVTDGATLGLSSPDRVGLWLAILGAWKAGALPGLIDARTADADLPYFVGDVAAPVVAAPPELHDRLRAAGAGEVVDLTALGAAHESTGRIDRHGPDALLYLSYTSGTTGAPKGAVLRSEPVTLGTSCIADRLGLRHDDVLLATTPISSSFQLVAALMPALHTGASVGLVAGSSIDDIWATAVERAATVLVAYPLTLADVVHHRRAGAPEGHPFRLALSGGSPLAPRLKREYRDRLGIPLLESYGQSELGGFMAMGRPDDGERALAGYVGRPLPDRRAYVGDPATTVERPAGEIGEVLVGHGYFAEYRAKPERTAEATAGGVLHTGDLAVADDDGYLKVLGRTNEADAAAARGGFLRELEDALYEHPAVQHAAVVARSDGAIAAFVELRSGASADAGELADVARAAVAPGLQPASVTILDAMPRSFSGKADRRGMSLM